MADSFDRLMASTCDILEKRTYGQGTDDGYGQPSQQLITRITAWPCRVSKGGGSSYKQVKESGKGTLKVYMRPPLVDDSGVAFTLGIHHWLIVDGDKYDIQGIDDPSKVGHHLEVGVEIILP